jgi:hypothetical protein
MLASRLSHYLNATPPQSFLPLLFISVFVSLTFYNNLSIIATSPIETVYELNVVLNITITGNRISIYSILL